MEISRLGVELELQLLAYTTATAMPYLSDICNLHHSMWQCWILTPLGESRDRTHILMDTSQVLNLLSHNGNSSFILFSFLWPRLWHMEVPRPGVKLELQLLAYTIATATQDPSSICSHSSGQCRILNSLSEARDQTHSLMDPSRVR